MVEAVIAAMKWRLWQAASTSCLQSFEGRSPCKKKWYGASEPFASSKKSGADDRAFALRPLGCSPGLLQAFVPRLPRARPRP